MNAELITADFKKRQVIERVKLGAADKKPGLDIARNKKLTNDLKAMMDGITSQVDFYPAILLIPNSDQDLYVKINGTDLTDADIAGIARIHNKLRQSNVKP